MKKIAPIRLIDVAPLVEKPVWLGRLDVMPRFEGCPDCGEPLRTTSGGDKLALFWLHGFGAIERTTYQSCPCGYWRHWKTETITPLSLRGS